MAHNHQQRPSGPPPPEPYQGPPPLPLKCPPGDDYPIELFRLLEPEEMMRKHGFVMEPLTMIELKGKARCKDCNQSMFNLTKDLRRQQKCRRANPVPPPPKKSWDPFPTILIPKGKGRYDITECTVPCRSHPGTMDRATRCFTCCHVPVSEAKPCVNSQVHELRNYAPGELVRIHQYHYTPPSSRTEGLAFRAAVAIDCEMGTAISGDSELIRLTAIDYLTGEVLINNLVQPDQHMLHLNTKFSGVTFLQLNEAKRKKTSLRGKAGAREALWRFVGPHTALVGHGLNNDLRALKWIHPTVIDSYMVEHRILQAKKMAEKAAAEAAAAVAAATATTESSAEELAEQIQDSEPSPQTESQPKQKRTKGTGDLALKTLMKKYIDRDIQTQGNKGHDSFEDALAARDLVHWMVLRSLAEKEGLAM